MSELSRSLVDAAAEAAITRAAQLSKEIANSKGQNPYVGDKFERAVMESALAAALETLAAALGKDPVELMDLIGHGKAYNEGKSYVIERVRRLAVETREEQP